MDLVGKTALITGVSRRKGIGAAIAREFARAGARLFISYYPKYDMLQSWGGGPEEPELLLREIRSIGVDVAGLELNLAEPAAPATLFSHARERFGRIDILVNNAAHWEPSGVVDVRPAQLDRHYAVNVRAPVLLCAEFARARTTRTPGVIVNITSGQGCTPMPGNIAYAVTKASLDALTLTLSAELAAQGIRLHAVDPGPTDTGWISDTLRAELLNTSSTAILSPESIGRLVRILAVDDTAAFSGHVLRAQSWEASALLQRHHG